MSTESTAVTGTSAANGTYGTPASALASSAVTSNAGTGATFIVVNSAGTATYTLNTLIITVVNPGSGYAFGQQIKILGNVLGGATPANDLTRSKSCWPP